MDVQKIDEDRDRNHDEDVKEGKELEAKKFRLTARLVVWLPFLMTIVVRARYGTCYGPGCRTGSLKRGQLSGAVVGKWAIHEISHK